MKPADTVPALRAPWAQTASGKALPLGRAIEPGMLDIRRDIATPLGLTGRFGNQTPSGLLYSVAQHCNIGCDWILAQTGDHVLAMAFLCHEGHEAILGDWTEPVVSAMQEQLDTLRLELNQDKVPRLLVRHIKQRLADPIDRYVHAEAGLPWPLPKDIRERVHLLDRQLLLTERKHLLSRPPRPWDEALERLQPLNLKHQIKPMSAAKATEQWLLRFEQWSARLHAERAAGQGMLFKLQEIAREAAE